MRSLGIGMESAGVFHCIFMYILVYNFSYFIPRKF